MNEERSFERFVADKVAGQHSGIPLPDDFYDDMHSFATTTRQRPKWLALIKEPPMRTNSRVAVGSPTARVFTILAATMLLMVALAAAGVAGQRLLAAEDDAYDIVVAQDSSGDYETITEAIAAAADRDSVLVMAGDYVESLIIDKDIQLRGEDRDSVRVLPAEDGPTRPDYWMGGQAPPRERPFVVLIDGADAVLESITVVQSTGDHVPITVSGGSPTISDVGHEFSTEWDPFATLYIDGGRPDSDDRATTTIRGSDFGGWIVVEDGSSVDVEGTRAVRLHIDTEPGTDSRISANSLGSMLLAGHGIAEGNRLEAIDWEGFANWMDTPAIDIERGEWTIEDNLIEGYDEGIVVTVEGVELIDNTLTDNAKAIALPPGEHVVIGNRVTGGDKGIVLQLGSSSVEGNSVSEVSGRAMEIKSGATPVLRGNTLCGNTTNLWVSDSAEPDIDESNEVCED